MGGQLSKDGFFELASLIKDFPDQPIFEKETLCTALGNDNVFTVENLSTQEGFARILTELTLPYRRPYSIEATMWLWPQKEDDVQNILAKNCPEIAGLEHSVSIMNIINQKILLQGLCPNFLPLVAYGKCNDIELLEKNSRLKSIIHDMRTALLKKHCVPSTESGGIGWWQLWRRQQENPIPLSLHVALTSIPITKTCKSLQDLANTFNSLLSNRCTSPNLVQFEATLFATVFAINIMNVDAGVFHNDLTPSSVSLRDLHNMPRSLIVYIVGSGRLPEDIRILSEETLRYQPLIGHWVFATSLETPNKDLDVKDGACEKLGRCSQPPPQFDIFQLICMLWDIHPNLNHMIEKYIGTSGVETIWSLRNRWSRCIADRSTSCGPPCIYARYNEETKKMETPHNAPFPTPSEFLTNYVTPEFMVDRVLSNLNARNQFEKHGAAIFVAPSARNRTSIEQVKDYLRNRFHYLYQKPIQQQQQPVPVQVQVQVPPSVQPQVPTRQVPTRQDWDQRQREYQRQPEWHQRRPIIRQQRPEWRERRPTFTAWQPKPGYEYSAWRPKY